MNSIRTKARITTRKGLSANARELQLPLRYGLTSRPSLIVKDGLTSLLRTPPTLLILFLALTLSLPAAIVFISDSLKSAEANLLKSHRITIFLNKEASLPHATALATELTAHTHIESAQPIPVTTDNGDVISIAVQPAAGLNDTSLQQVIDDLDSHADVVFVAADAVWLHQSTTAIESTQKFTRLSILLAALLTALLAFAITTADLLRGREENIVLNQLGATRSIRLRPLLLSSPLLAVLAVGVGTLCAWGIIQLAPKYVDLSLYENILPGSLPLASMLLLALLAALCSFMTVKILRKIV